LLLVHKGTNLKPYSISVRASVVQNETTYKHPLARARRVCARVASRVLGNVRSSLLEGVLEARASQGLAKAADDPARKAGDGADSSRDISGDVARVDSGSRDSADEHGGKKGSSEAHDEE
jgi:hypothetical protein